MPDTLAQYNKRVAAGDFEYDAAQAAVAKTLAALNARLEAYRLARKSSALGWLFSRRSDSATPMKGLYIWGEVGRGKTMLMDLFFAGCPIQKKRRAHFLEFMADVHERVHTYRQKLKAGQVKGDDPIIPVADDLADEATLLCFDEFTVTDIADAMLLGRLFAQLFARGVVVVCTSNVVPQELYKGGLNRSLFLPFIDMIQSRMDVVKLASRTDFRLEKMSGQPVWITPIDEASDNAMNSAWERLTGGGEGRREILVVKGHDFIVPQQADGVARFTFAQLCELPLGGSDYLALARTYHTVLIDHIPVLTADRLNVAKRFIILIDALYDHHVKLVASAGAEPVGLFLGEDGREAFEFARTVSRLIEMRSIEYIALPHGRPDSEASGDTTGIVET